MPRAPLLPASQTDPQGTDGLERRAMKEFARRLNRVRRVYIDALDMIPYQVVEVLETNARRYEFRLDQVLLSNVFASTDAIVNSIMLEGGEQNWFFNNYVQVAYQQGTAKTVSNLARQSQTYQAGTQSLRAVISNPVYSNRIALVRAREFEEMKGLTADVKARMSRTLAEGVGRGLNPLEISRTLTEQTGIAKRRANAIARTEVGTALRNARLDEKDAAAKTYGIKSKMMCLSALSPTTRATHAARHAKLFTSDEVRDFQSKDGNAINCKCGYVEVIVDDKGKPLFPGVQERAMKNKEVAEERMRENAA